MDTEILNLQEYRSNLLVEDAKYYISEKQTIKAKEALNKAISFHPNAEAYSYLGWLMSLEEDYTLAIELCNKAIEIDPDLGNPYNDLGNIYIKQKKYDEAILLLEKAKLAKNYGPRHFPFINLGRIFVLQGKFHQAISEFQKALDIEPDHPEVIKVLAQIKLFEAL